MAVSNENIGVSNENMAVSNENMASPTDFWGLVSQTTSVEKDLLQLKRFRPKPKFAI